MSPPALAEGAPFFTRLAQWQRDHGRHGLPWQGTREPYRVWLSEVMLQQTQVSTVLDYYPRFLQRFPTVQALAQAPQDEVLALWSGLGYYSRARNLHRCAQAVVAQWGGQFPRTAAELQSLHGIGPSTAAAIAAFCFGERISILDGNVKRVLSRLLAFDGDLAEAAQERQLWQRAQDLLPAQPSHDDMVTYTQGLMDLGSGLCSRSKPSCLLCPVQNLCQAHAQQRPTAFPVKTRKLVRTTQDWWLLVCRNTDGAIWLQQRPQKGIWAGLYSVPVFATQEDALAAVAHWSGPGAPVWHETVRHSLTHRELVLHPLEVRGATDTLTLPGGTGGVWVGAVQDLTMGLPTPVRRWLERHLPA